MGVQTAGLPFAGSRQLEFTSQGPTLLDFLTINNCGWLYYGGEMSSHAQNMLPITGLVCTRHGNPISQLLSAKETSANSTILVSGRVFASSDLTNALVSHRAVGGPLTKDKRRMLG